MIIVYFLFFLLVLLFFLLFFLYLSFLIGFFVSRVPFISSKKKFFSRLLEIINLKEGEVFVDLGCGDSRLLIEAEKKYKVRTIGYELSLTAFIISKINIFLKKAKTKIYFQDFFKADLSQVDVVFCYLYPPVMSHLSKKLKEELKLGARIFSLAFPLPDWPEEKIFYLDEKNKKDGVFIYHNYK